MNQNRYHGKCAVCEKVVKPFEGYIVRHGYKSFAFKHESCLGKGKEVLGQATQPVREPESKLCALCDKWKAPDRFNGKKCIECWARQLRVSAESPYVGW